MCLLYRAIYPVHAVWIKMAAMLQIPRVFPRVSCLGSANVVQCPRPGPNIGNKSQQIPRYSPVCPRGQPPGMAADKCIKSKATSVPQTPQTNHSQYSSPVEALNLIVDSKSQPVELDNSAIGVTCAIVAKE